jgi:hypothetical protein
MCGCTALPVEVVSEAFMLGMRTVKVSLWLHGGNRFPSYKNQEDGCTHFYTQRIFPK